MPEVANPTIEAGALVLTLAASGIGAKRADGTVDSLVSWNPASGDVSLGAPVGTDGGGGTRVLSLLRPVSITGTLAVSGIANLSTASGAVGGFVTSAKVSGYDALGWDTASGLVLGGFRAAQWTSVKVYTGAALRLTVNAGGATLIGALDASGAVSASAHVVTGSYSLGSTGALPFMDLNGGAFRFLNAAGSAWMPITCGQLTANGTFGCNGNAPVGKQVSGGTLAGVIAGLVAIGLFSS